MSRLTDNEVAEVANMQKRIDNLEAYMENLWLNIRYYEEPIRNMCLKDEDSDSTFFFEGVWKFVRYCKENHPEIKEEIMHKGQQE